MPTFRGSITAALLLFLISNPGLAETSRTPALGALVVRGNEVAAIMPLLDNGELWLSLEDLFLIPGIGLEQDTRTVTTPLGKIPLERLSSDNNPNGYVSLSDLKTHLKIQGSWNPKTVALEINPPWPVRMNNTGSDRALPEPDFRSPPNSFNGVRYDYRTTGIYDDLFQEHELTLQGRLNRGPWRAVAYNNEAGQQRMNELFWLYERQHYRSLTGIQSVQYDPVLPTTEFTGVQLQFANFTLPEVSSLSNASLQPAFGPDQRVIRGQGPLGGSVELRLDGDPIARSRIDFEGEYRIEVPSDLGRFGSLEVWVYEFDPRGEPIRRESVNYLASAQLLNPGQWSIQGGGGASGNALDTEYTDTGEAAFANTRYGLTDRITLEAVTLRDQQGEKYIGGGTTFSWLDGLQSRISLYTNEAGNAAGTLSFQGVWGPNEVQGYWNEREEGFVEDTRRVNAQFDASRRMFANTTRAGLLARKRQDSVDDIHFALPYFYTSPSRYVSLGARPNFNGNYRSEAHYRPSRPWHFQYVNEEATDTLRADYDISRAWQVYVSRHWQNEDTRDEAGFGWFSPWRKGLFVQGAVIHESNGTGYRVNMRHRILPGLYANLSLTERVAPEIPGFGDINDSDTYVFLEITADFKASGGKLYPTAALGGDQNLRGGIFGTVRLPDGSLAPIDNLRLLLDEQPREAAESPGRFAVENIRPGTYKVRLDPAALPIEYTPKKHAYWVEVEQGATTSLHFDVELEYGVAGQVRIPDAYSGKPIRLELKSAQSGFYKTVWTNQFGYYRIDGVPPGEYRLNLAGRDYPVRNIKVENDFLFGQDLVISELPNDPFN